MARPKPIGFDNWQTFSFVSNDGSGFTFFRKASFSLEVGGNHSLFAGASIASTDAATYCGITTDEAHGFHVGQTIYLHGLPSAVAALNGIQVITHTPSTTIFQVAVDTTSLGTTTGIGLTGADLEARIPVVNYCIVPGGNATEDYPEAWENPLVG
tara:strand:- start:35 stop:499 length:465 start_codon:yes stop_codon:yes gene_type:complete